MSCPETLRLVGDPIDVVTGANIERNLDFRLIGPLHLEWHRHYDSSRAHEPHPLGNGQTHHFDRYLLFDLDGIRYHGPLGRATGFPLPEPGGPDVTANGRLLRRWSDGRFWLYERGAPIMEFEAIADPTVAMLTALIDRKNAIVFGYDASGRLESITDAAGRYIRVRGDAYGRITEVAIAGGPQSAEQRLQSYRYDTSGNLVESTGSDGRSRTFAYDASNRLVERTDRSGYTFRFEYDDAGRCIRSAGEDGLQEIRLEYVPHEKMTRVTRGDGGRWSYHWNDDGVLTAIVDPYGGIRRFETDERGRVAVETDALGNATRWQYGPTGAMTGKRDVFGRFRPEPADPDDMEGAIAIASCPAEWEFGRLVDHARIVPPGAGALSLRRLPAALRSLVRMRRDDDPDDRVSPWPVEPFAMEWRPLPVRGREFDGSGRLVQQRGPEGAIRTWEYDAGGNVRRYTDFDGRAREYKRASWNLLVREIDALGAVIERDYTVHEKVAAVTDAGGTESEYAWDRADRLLAVRRNGTVRERYIRDAAGNLVAKQDGDGNDLLRLTIGPGNTVKERRLGSGSVHEFSHDEHGRLTDMIVDGEATTFEHDRWNNRSAERGPNGDVEHVFEGWQKPVQTSIVGTFITRYERTGTTITITDPAGNTQRFEIPGNGLVLRELPRGIRELTQFDWNGRTLVRAVDRGRGRSIQWTDYRYSGEGDLVGVRESSGETRRFEYDAVHRLVRASGAGATSTFEYDLASNLIAQPGLDGVRIAAGNRLATANGDGFTYDARSHIAERVTPRGIISYYYDSRDQLTRIAGPGLDWSADYDGLGRRTRKTVNGETTRFLWDSERMAAEIHHDGRIRIYIYIDPLALAPISFVDYASVDATPETGRSFFIHHDQISTPARVSDTSGDTVWEGVTQPYGRLDVRRAQIDLAPSYPGHFRDAETGLHYNRFRQYSPELGRYLQSDPIGVSGGINLYAYPASPLSNVDVRGLTCPECEERAAQAGQGGEDEEDGRPTLCPHERAELDEKFGPATDPWLVRNGEGVYPPDGQIVTPGQPLVLDPYTAPNGQPGSYVWIIDQNGNMHVAPTFGALGRETKHTDLAQNGPARISGELQPTNDPNVWVMNDGSGRYSYEPVPPPPARPQRFNPTRTGDQLQNANNQLNQANLGNSSVVNEADLYGESYGR